MKPSPKSSAERLRMKLFEVGLIRNPGKCQERICSQFSIMPVWHQNSGGLTAPRTEFNFTGYRSVRKTKKKQLMVVAKALYLNQPKGSNFTLRQIVQKLKDVLKAEKPNAQRI